MRSRCDSVTSRYRFAHAHGTVRCGRKVDIFTTARLNTVFPTHVVALLQVVLEKVFGFTVSSNARLSQSCEGTIAYLAGCVIVLYDPNTQKQDFIISQARKTLTTVAFSADGRTLATGEVRVAFELCLLTPSLTTRLKLMLLII